MLLVTRMRMTFSYDLRMVTNHGSRIPFLILFCHPSRVATHQRNTQNTPIDGIFATEGVKVLAGGYYAFNEHVSSDHRGLWIDLDMRATLGIHQPVEKGAQSRLLSSQDSR